MGRGTGPALSVSKPGHVAMKDQFTVSQLLQMQEELSDKIIENLLLESQLIEARKRNDEMFEKQRQSNSELFHVQMQSNAELFQLKMQLLQASQLTDQILQQNEILQLQLQISELEVGKLRLFKETIMAVTTVDGFRQGFYGS
jgi:hypothetical protein